MVSVERKIYEMVQRIKKETNNRIILKCFEYIYIIKQVNFCCTFVGEANTNGIIETNKIKKQKLINNIHKYISLNKLRKKN